MRSVDLGIRVNGYHLYGVYGGDRRDPPTTWVHTIGLSEMNLPELVVTELEFDRAEPLLKAFAISMLDGVALEDVAAKFGATVGTVDARHLDGDHVFTAWRHFYGAQPSTVEWRQVFPPDDWYCEVHGGTTVRLDRPGRLSITSTRAGRPARASPKPTKRTRQ